MVIGSAISGTSVISKIKKRDGTVVEFVKEKITNAIYKAAHAVCRTDKKLFY